LALQSNADELRNPMQRHLIPLAHVIPTKEGSRTEMKLIHTSNQNDLTTVEVSPTFVH
jgi:hypothetical protein